MDAKVRETLIAGCSFACNSKGVIGGYFRICFSRTRNVWSGVQGEKERWVITGGLVGELVSMLVADLILLTGRMANMLSSLSKEPESP